MDMDAYYEKNEDYDSPTYYTRGKDVVVDGDDDENEENDEKDVGEEDSIHHADVLFHNDKFYDGEEQKDIDIIWEVVLDPNTKEKYFYNTITGEAQWEEPPGLVSHEYTLKSNTKNNNNESAISDFMESEEDKLIKKFEKMKLGAKQLRYSENNDSTWVEWQGANEGAIFYSQHGEKGGQWKLPVGFNDNCNVVNNNFNIDNNFKNDSNVNDNPYIPSPKSMNVMNSNSVAFSPLKPRTSPLTNLLSRTSRQQNNDDIELNQENLPNKNSNYQEERIKLEYRHLRAKDVEAEVIMEFADLKKRTEEAKLRWRKYVGPKDLTESTEIGTIKMNQVKSKVDSDSDDESKDKYIKSKTGEQGSSTINNSSSSDFNALYARSIVLKQVWPWTCLADVKTDKLFYRNELEDFFQLEMPADFEDKNEDNDIDSDDSDEDKIAQKNSIKSYQIKKSDGATDLVQRFKDELRQRNIFANRDHSIRTIASTSTQLERNIYDKGEYDTTGGSNKKGQLNAASIVNKIRRFAHVGALPAETSSGMLPNQSTKVKQHRKSIFIRSENPKKFKNNYSTPEGYSKEFLENIYENIIHFSSKNKDKKDKSILSPNKKRTNNIRSSSNNNDADILLHRLRKLPVKDVNDLNMYNLIQQRTSLEKLKKSKLSAKSVIMTEEEKLTMLKLAVAKDVTKQADLIRGLTERVIEILDETDQNSWIEKEMFRRHLLEVSVMQRSQLVMPLSIREAKSHQSIPLHVCCPHALESSDLEKKNCIYTTKTVKKWKIYSDPDGNFETLFSHSSSKNTIQKNEPFELRVRHSKNSFITQDWCEFESYLGSTSLLDHLRSLDLISDEDGGPLFYCPKRDAYSYNGRFDSDKYNNKSTKKILSSSQKKFKHKMSKALEDKNGKANSTLDRNVWTKIKYELGKNNKTSFNSRLSSPTRSASNSPSSINKKSSKFVPPPSPVSNNIKNNQSNGSLLMSPYKANKNEVPNTNGDIAEFESFLGVIIENEDEELKRELLEKQLFAQSLQDFEKDHGTLYFEDNLSTDSYADYRTLLLKVVSSPSDPYVVMQLAVWLLMQGLGLESYAVVTRVHELLMTGNRQGIEDYSMFKIMENKMAMKYKGKFMNIKTIKSIVSNNPENSTILAQAGMYFHKLRFVKQAEQMYVGSLMINPLGSDGLRGYAHLLLEQENYQSVLRYLSRVPDNSACYPITRTEIAWVHEIIGSDSDAIMLAYKKSTLNTSSVYRDGRVSSLSLQSQGHFYHVRGDYAKAIEFYNRASSYYPQNGQAQLLKACITDRNFLSLNKSDSSFRKGLFYLKDNIHHKWITLISYGDFAASSMKDLHHAEQLYRDASTISLTTSAWSSIALGHFLQYQRGQTKKARRVLRWSLRCRRSLSVDTNVDSDSDSEDEYVYKKEKKMSPEPDDIISILVSLAYCNVDLNELSTAKGYAIEALKIDPCLTSAHRCLGIISWLGNEHEGNRAESVKHFSTSMKYAGNNPYTLRTVACIQALEGNYKDALKLMTLAVQSGPNCPLAWRALGMMTYLYTKNKENSTVYLQKAFDLSDQLDVESIRLKGQILMELGQHAEARVCFQYAMKVHPGDSITIASLAMSLSAMGFVAPRIGGPLWIDYDTRFEQLNSLNQLITSEDPEELFQAAITVGLERIIRKRVKDKRKADADRFAWILNRDSEKSMKQPKIVENYNEEAEETTEGEDANVEVLYWYGMYHMKKNSPKSMSKAKVMFTRAVQRRDCSPHPMAVYMLGWIAELQGDYNLAEKYYCYSLQIEPMDPLNFLRLYTQVNDTLSFVTGLTKTSEQITLRKKKMIKRKQKTTRIPSNSQFGIAESRLVMNSKNKDEIDENEENKALKKYGAIPGVTEMRKRLILHERVVNLSELKRKQLQKSLNDVSSPGKLVYIDPFWLDRLLYSFSQCDDWAWLMKSSKSIRNRKIED